MRVVPLGDSPYTKRHNPEYEEHRAGFCSLGSRYARCIEGFEKRVLALPESIGKVAKAPPGARNCHLFNHYVIWWRVFRQSREVEFLAIGHHDLFFGR